MSSRFSRSVRALLVLTNFSVLGGCGSGTPEIPPELIDPPGDGDGDGDENYPAGPYGKEVGDTLEDFSFQGYPQPDVEKTPTEISFSDFYDPEGKEVKLLLLNTAAAWCQPCQIEHQDLPDRVREYEGQGLKVFSLLFQDSDGSPPSFETLNTWTQLFDTNFPMAIDPSYQMGRYGPSETPPLNLVVDPTNMTLIARFIGNQEGPMWALIESELEKRNNP